MTLKEYLAENSQTDLARTLGVTQGLVWQWVSGSTRVTAERAIAIETATNRQVTRYELRPDIFGLAPTERAKRAGLVGSESVK